MEIPKVEPQMHQFEIIEEEEAKPRRPFLNFIKYSTITLASSYMCKYIN
jgi:hypothetical protein